VVEFLKVQQRFIPHRLVFHTVQVAVAVDGMEVATKMALQVKQV
jgi:hypothetical protein